MDGRQRICSICDGISDQINQTNLLGILISNNYRCQDCKTFFRHPMPSQEDLSRHYAEGNSRYSASIQKAMADRQVRWLSEAIDEVACCSDPIEFLEYGAGQGWFVAAVNRVLAVDTAVGVDADGGAIQWGRDNLDVNLIQGFVGSNFKENREFVSNVSLVAMMHVLEHVSNPGDLLASIRRRHENAALFIEVPDGRFEGPVFTGDVFPWSSSGEHLWSFSDTGLTQLLKNAGYEILRLDSVGNPKFWNHRLRSIRLANSYRENYLNWESEGGGTRNIVGRSGKTFLSGLYIALRNMVGRVSREELPSLRVLVQPDS